MSRTLTPSCRVRYEIAKFLFDVPSPFVCLYGLTNQWSSLDSGLLDDEEPSSEPSDANTDTDITDTNDTNTDTNDTNDTNDTDTDTEPFLAGLITSSTPLYGSTAGGDTVSIYGGPFTSDATVTFGGYPGIVLSNNGSMIRVNTPAASVDGPVEVRVDMDDGFGLAPDAFIYFSDAIGKTATLGVVNKTEYVGTYWNGTTPAPEANIWTAFTNPLDIHYWHHHAGTQHLCKRRYRCQWRWTVWWRKRRWCRFNDSIHNGNLTVFDIGATSITFDGTSNITLTRASSDPNYPNTHVRNPGGMDASLMPDNAFYDLNVTSGSLDWQWHICTPSRQVVPFSPGMSSSSHKPSVAPKPLVGVHRVDWMQIRMYQLDSTNGYIISDVVCNVDDTEVSPFKHPSTVDPGNPVYVLFSRFYESNVTMPYNDGISRVDVHHCGCWVYGSESNRAESVAVRYRLQSHRVHVVHFVQLKFRCPVNQRHLHPEGW